MKLIKAILYSLSALSLVTLWTPLLYAAKDSSVIKSTGIPEGFEDLVESQTTLVDVYYRNKKIVETLATFGPEAIMFESPKQIISAIPDLLQNEIVEKALSESLSQNSDQICFYPEQEDCNNLIIDVAGVIFDSSTYKVQLFINPSLLSTPEIRERRYISPPTDAFSGLHSVFFNYNHTDINAQSSININNQFRKDKWSLNSLYFDRENLSGFRSFSTQYEEPDFILEGGSFRSFGSNASVSLTQEMVGFRAYSNFKHRVGLDSLQASNIRFYMKSSGSVEVYQDGIFLDSQIYGSGHQLLNTSNLPEGSYNIRLRIKTDDGQVEERDFFFNKTSLLPPVNETAYFFEGGKLHDFEGGGFLKTENESLFKFGLARRINDNFGLEASYLNFDKTSLTDLGFYWFYNNFLVQTALLADQDSNLASRTNINFYYKDFTVNANYLINDRNEQNSATTNLIDDIKSDLSIYTRAPLLQGDVTLSFRERKTFDNNSSAVTGLGFRYPLYQRNNYIIELNGRASKIEQENEFALGFTVRFLNKSQQIFYRGSLGNNNINGSISDHQLAYTRNDYFESIGTNQFGATLESSDSDNRARLRNDLYSRYGYLSFDHLQSNKQSNATQFQARGSFAHTENNIAIGGSRNVQSAAILVLNDPENLGQEYDVLVNNSPRIKIRSGETILLPLEVYKEFSISLKPRGSSFSSFDNSPLTVTTYPGGLNEIVWDIKPLTVIMGRLVNIWNKPLAGMLINQQPSYALTDDEGYFQVEISESSIIRAEGQLGKCEFELQNIDYQEAFNFIGDITCKDYSGANNKVKTP